MSAHYSIAIADEQQSLSCSAEMIRRAVEYVLQDAEAPAAEISVAIVDDDTMHELNRRHLDHDYPTDVLSFPLSDSSDLLEGEIIVSSDTALRQAPQHGLSPHDELLLYVVHGTLHLVGLQDHTDPERQAMRSAERRIFSRLRPGILLPPGEDTAAPLEGAPVS